MPRTRKLSLTAIRLLLSFSGVYQRIVSAIGDDESRIVLHIPSLNLSDEARTPSSGQMYENGLGGLPLGRAAANWFAVLKEARIVVVIYAKNMKHRLNDCIRSAIYCRNEPTWYFQP